MCATICPPEKQDMGRQECGDKLKGLLALDEEGWPVPKTLILRKPTDLAKIAAFIAKSGITLWLLRPLCSSVRRYEIGNHVATPPELRRLCDRWPWTEADFPFCVQPFVQPIVSGILLVRREETYCEFTRGSSGRFLGGYGEPLRAMFRSGLSYQRRSISSRHTSSDREIARSAARVACGLSKGREYIAEWIEDPSGELFFVDLKNAPRDFLPSVRPLGASSKVIYPGELSGPHWAYREGQEPSQTSVVVSDWPRLDLVRWLEARRIGGLIIRKGGWLSHATVRAAELQIPCRVGHLHKGPTP